MSTITTKDGTQIYYKDWRSGLVEKLDLKDTIQVGHSTGGGVAFS